MSEIKFEHLGSRLDAALGRSPSNVASNVASNGAAHTPGCEFVREGAPQLKGMPQFPDLGEMNWEYALPALPALLPQWQQLLWKEVGVMKTPPPPHMWHPLSTPRFPIHQRGIFLSSRVTPHPTPLHPLVPLPPTPFLAPIAHLTRP